MKQTATHGALQVQKDEAASDDGGVGVAVAVSRLFFSNGLLGGLMTNGYEWLAEAVIFCPNRVLL